MLVDLVRYHHVVHFGNDYPSFFFLNIYDFTTPTVPGETKLEAIHPSSILNGADVQGLTRICRHSSMQIFI